MKVQFVDVRDKQGLSNIKLQEGDVLMGLNIGEKNEVTKEGVPQHRIYSALKVITFGIQRFQKQDARNSICAVAGQTYNFLQQFPGWKLNRMFRPIYDINPDDTLATALLDPDIGPVIREQGSKLKILLTELIEWNTNRYMFVKQFHPTLLNNILNEYPFPFRDIPGRTRIQSVSDYFFEQQAWYAENIEQIVPSVRVFPFLKWNILFHNDRSVLIFIESERYGSDDLVAQAYFQANPMCVRVVLVRKIHNSVKHFVSIVNSQLFDSNMNLFNYPNIKELNVQEKKIDGDPNWKNLKLSATGPHKGSSLPFETIWNLTRILS